MEKFQHFFKGSMKTQIPLLNVVLNYLTKRKGKQIRPLLVFLTARLFGDTNQKTYTAASLIELLHTATLIHDDVVDESYERRGFFSINALWKSKVSVLTGDYLLSRGLLLSLENHSYDLLSIVSESVKQMSEGELLQIQKTRKLNITRDEYYDIIHKKTASLIASCTACGAASTDARMQDIERMKKMGEYIGIAYQIKDDLFDFTKTSKIGKPSGNDIKNKKLTLPLIYSLENCDAKTKKRILRLINHSNMRGKDALNEIASFVEEHEGIAHASEQIDLYKTRALELLESFPENEIKDAFKQLINYVISRNK